MTELILIVLLLFMIVGAIIAIEMRDLISSVICVGAIGYLASVAFLFLGAPDIAITQVVVEILVLIVLIRATISRDLTSPAGDREFFGLTVSIALLLLVGALVVNALGLGLPEFGKPAFTTMPGAPGMYYLKNGLRETGAANQVTAIILDYRGFDTLLEATVLFTAVLGALTVLRARARKRVDEEIEDSLVIGEEAAAGRGPAGMTGIVKTVSNWLVGFIFMFGLYIVLFGHLTPGGGFAGGVIIACTYVLLTLAFGRGTVEEYLPRRWAHKLDSAGALLFLVIAWLGIYFGGTFFVNFLGKGEPFRFLSGGTIVLSNIAIGIKVMAALFLAFISLSVLRVVIHKNGDGKLVKKR